MRPTWFALLLAIGCGSPAAPPSSSPTPSNAPALVCTLDPANVTACCKMKRAVDTCDPARKVAGLKVADDPCKLDCGAGESAVELAPNADESRWGCVACP